MDQLRHSLVAELCELLEKNNYIIHGAIDNSSFPSPAPVTNGRFGDLNDVTPDVEAFDLQDKRVVYGIVCTTNKEIDSEDTQKRWNVFLNRDVKKGEKTPLVVVMVPSANIQDLTSIITHALHPEYWESVRLVRSEKY